MSQYTASLHPRRRVEERALASLWLEGNAAEPAPAKAGVMPCWWIRV
ncbi:MAG: hypothetical protein V1758_12180 [Pseudomonadota bacterium]